MRGTSWRVGVAALACVACAPKESRAPGQPGLVDASSLDLRSGPPEPLDPADLEGITRRGVELHWLEVGLGIADAGLARAGRTDAGALLPLASVDEGAHSGQVAFYRWRSDAVPESGELDPARAQRWLVVPYLLRPERLLDNEQFSVAVEKGTDEYWLLGGVIQAAQSARRAHAKGRWHMHPFREARPDGTRRIRATRVYMFGLDDHSPDLEAVVEDPRRKGEAPKVQLVLVHDVGDRSGAGLRTRTPSVGPLTVARVRARGVEGGTVRVTTADGTVWPVSAETGAIEAPSE